MTNIWKRSLSLFLAFVMVFGMVPVNAFAVEEELVEEVLVEELIEEEILEEELVEEEAFEEEAFEEEEIEEEPAEVTVEEYHAADELANEVAAEGTIWVNKAKMEDEIFDILKEDGKIKTLILDSVFGEGNYDSTYTVEYACTYEGVDIVVEADDEHFAEKCGIALSEEVENSDDNSAIFLVNGEETKIIFKDSRYVAKISVGNTEIENKGALTKDQVEKRIKDSITVTGTSPKDPTDVITAALGADYSVEINYLDANGEDSFFNWPKAQETLDVEVIIAVTNDQVYDLDNAVYEEAYFTLKDTRGLYTVKYATYYKYQTAGDAVVVKTFENVVEGDEIPAYTPADQDYYVLGDWSSAADEDGNVTFTAVWSPKDGFDANKNGKADQEDEYQVYFYDDDETLLAQYSGKLWGTPFASLIPVVERAGSNFAGWTKYPYPGATKVELPATVVPNGSKMTWEFFASWTEDYVVTFYSPITGAPDHYETVSSDGASKVAKPTKTWPGVVVTGWTLNGQPYAFDAVVEGNLDLKPVFFDDANGNGKLDGSEEDPFYTHIWTVDGKEVDRQVILADKNGNQNVDFYVYDDVKGDKVTFDKEYGVDGWETTVSEDGLTTTYATVLAADTNGNNVADRKETVNVTVEGEGTVTIDGTKVSGTYVYDSTKSVNTVKAAPKMDGAYTATFVGSINLDGTAQELVFSNYAASVRLNGAETVEVVFYEAGFAAEGGDLETHAGDYTAEEVYAKAVQAPNFIEGTVVKYLARAGETIPVNIAFVKDIVYGKTSDTATRQLFDEKYNEYTNGTDTYNMTYTAEWLPIGTNPAVVETLDACIDRWTAWMENPDVTLIDVKDKLNTMLEELKQTNYHAFGNDADGVETISVAYKGKDQNIYAETYVNLVETRTELSIVKPEKLTVKYGTALDLAALLKNVYVKDENGNRIDATVEVVWDANYEGNVGTYTFTLKVADFGDYKGCEVAYTVVVEKAAANIQLPETEIIPGGSDVDTTIETDVEIVQIIAGIDIDSVGINLETGEVSKKMTAKAWIKLPQRMLDLIEEANNNPEVNVKIDTTDGPQKLDDLKKKLTEDYAKAFELANIDTGMIDSVVSYMDTLGNLMKRIGSEPWVDVTFVDEADEADGPENIGMYINMCVVTDPNYETEMLSSMLLIDPGVGLPNNGNINENLQLVRDGKAENLFESIANEKPVSLSVLFNGKAVDCTVRYFGVNSHAKPLAGTTAPSESGLYVAAATYEVNGELYTDAALIVIGAQQSSIDVSADVVKENGENYAPTVTIKNADNKVVKAAYTLISAEADLGKRTVQVNIDMPAKAKDLLNSLLEKVGYELPADITLTQLVNGLDKVNVAIDKGEVKIMELLSADALSGLGVDDGRIKEVLARVKGYVTAVQTEIKNVMADVGAEAVVSFENGKTYSKPGVYYFVGIVTDPDYLPSANAGYLVIENAQFAVEDAVVTLKEAEKGYELKPTDDAGRGYITLIKSSEGLNLLLDGDEELAIIAKFKEETGYDLSSGTITIERLMDKGEGLADKLADCIIESLEAKALAKLDAFIGQYTTGNAKLDNIKAKAVEILNENLVKVKDKIVNKILSIAEPYGNKTLSVNAALPKTEGKYEFHYLSYAVAYETATLEIVDDLFSIVGANILLGDTLDMYYYVMKSDLEGTDYYAEITRTYGNGKEDHVVTIPYGEWESKGSMMRFCYPGLAAKEMTDEMYITVYHADGTPASYEREDSIKMYAMRNLEDPETEEAICRAVVDMLNYGAAAQDYFSDYNINDLANAGTEEYQHFATTSIEYEDRREKGDNYYGSTVSAESELILTFYFKNITEYMTAHISYIDSYGHDKSHEISGSEFYAYNSTTLGARVHGLAVADGRQLVTCVIKDADGNEVARAVDSVESYVARSFEDDVVFGLMLKFVDSAYAYFHPTENS